MKYIRIKNGACAVNDESYNVKYVIPAEEYLEKYYFDAQYIIAQADTIEELVDATVIVSPKGSHSITLDEYDLVNLGNRVFIDSKWRNDLINAGNIIYGAIWTDKGLIYVAEMNDKGVLELI